MTEELMQNVTFDELYVGQTASIARVLTPKDVEIFAIVSGDYNPTHLDEKFAKSRSSQGVVGHSMWVGSLISSVLGTIMPGPGTVYLSQDLKFESPVCIGDEVTARITVKEKNRSHNTVTFECLCRNNKGDRVATGVAKVIAPSEKLLVPRPDIKAITVQQNDKYADILARYRKLGKIKAAVVHPTRTNDIAAIAEAVREGLIDPVLVGPEARIREAAAAAKIDISQWPLVDVPHSHAAAQRAAEMAAQGNVQAIMKGALHSDELLAAIVSSTSGLRTERRVSHAFVMDIPTYHKPLIITDAALNIAPKLEEKVDICQNAIDLWRILFGTEREPKVALLSAVETVTSRLPSTLDAACLCKMADRGQIQGGKLDGPLAFDNAISIQAVHDKGIISDVAGDTDILVVPNIEAGNALVKQLSFLGQADAAGIVLGARVPVILTSRADTLRARLLSCGVAVCLAHGHREGKLA